MSASDAVAIGVWVQTERTAHNHWAELIAGAPRAAQLAHLLVARTKNDSTVQISQKELICLMGVSRSTVQRAVKKLKELNWIEIERKHASGTNAYVINSYVAWFGNREKIRNAKFSRALRPVRPARTPSTHSDPADRQN